jgi:hypothetical protein
MTDTWEPIQRVSVEVAGIDPAATGLLNVIVTLNATPPQEWPHRFENPTAVDSPASMQPPRVNGTRVTIKVEDARLRESIENIDARIVGANDYYESEILPAKAAKAKTESDIRDEATRRITEAQRIADGL